MRRPFDKSKLMFMKLLFIPIIFMLSLASCDSKKSINDRYEPEPASGLYYMKSYVNEHPNDIDLWHTEPLNMRLKKLLGDQYQNFIANMEIQGTIALKGELLYVTGKKDEKGSNAAVLLGDVENDALYVWLIADKQIKLFKEKDPEPVLPDDVKKFLLSRQGS